jgi:hypothetical protein
VYLAADVGHLEIITIQKPAMSVISGHTVLREKGEASRKLHLLEEELLLPQGGSKAWTPGYQVFKKKSTGIIRDGRPNEHPVSL